MTGSTAAGARAPVHRLARPVDPPAPALQRRRRPKIVYVIQPLDYSGAELNQFPVLLSDVDPLVLCSAGSRVEELARTNGIPVVTTPFRSMRHSGGRRELLRSFGQAAAAVRDMRRVLRERPERRVVVALSLRAGLVASLASAGLRPRRRVVWHLVDFLPGGVLGHAVRLVGLAGCTLALPHSKAVGEDLAGPFRALAARSRVVYPGVDERRFGSREGEEADDGRTVVVVGHISPTKRTGFAIDVAERLLEQGVDVRLALVGRAQFRDEDFTYERTLKERVAASPALAEHVEFLGFTPTPEDIVRGAAVLLHVRPDEPYGIIVPEAMASGTPVVAPASGGCVETVRDGKDGFLYPPGDVGAAADAVRRLLTDDGLREAFGAAGRKKVQAGFTTRHMIAATDDALAPLLAGPNPS